MNEDSLYLNIFFPNESTGSPASKNLVDYLQKLRKRETDMRRPSELGKNSTVVIAIIFVLHFHKNVSSLACDYHKQEYDRNTALSFHIFSGRTVKDGEYPFMVALGYLNMEENKDQVPIVYNCGGTLITETHVLTAAHCVTNVNSMTPVQV